MMMNKLILILCILFPVVVTAVQENNQASGIVIERASGSVLLIDANRLSASEELTGLGDLSHASAVFSNGRRYAYIFGRDGGLTKLDLAERKISRRIIQGGNSIGGAISADGKLIAVSNYEPGGVKIFNADSLDLVADIPAVYGKQYQRSKVVGLVDAPGQKFIFSLFEAGEIWTVDMTDMNDPVIQKFKNIGKQPYDGLITPDGKYYIAGLFGEDGLAMLEVDEPGKGVRRILDGYGRGEKALPVYKMPHLEGWAVAGDYAFIPAVGHHSVIVANRENWQEVRRIPLHGQPVFAMARPDGKHVWINFALPHNDTIQVVDTRTLQIIKELKPGKAVMHMEFTADSNKVWVSVRDEDTVKVYDTNDFSVLSEMSAEKPSGIFLSSRADRIGL